MAFLILAGAAYAFWPPPIAPIRFWPDTGEYENWPKALIQAGVTLMDGRPVGYPATLMIFGSGPLLVHFQTWFSVGCWALLGWTIGRVPLMLVTLALASASSIRFWNSIVLTESLTLSLLALLIALTTILARQWRWSVFLAWLIAILWFAFLRDANLAIIPFLTVPLAYCGRLRMALAAAVVCVVLTLAGLDSSQRVRWKAGINTAFQTRVFWTRDTSHFTYFKARGVPASPLAADRKEFLEWLGEGGRRAYLSWMIRQPGSYTAPPKYLFRAGPRLGDPQIDLTEHQNTHYFKNWQPYRGSTTAAADYVFRWLALPLVVGLLLALLAPLEWCLRGSISLPSAWTSLLVATLLLHAFLSYNLSGSGHSRHLLASAVLYRLTPIYAVAAAVAWWRSRPGEQS